MAESIQFEVYSYSADRLAKVLSNEWVNATATRRKRHYHYFAEYLEATSTGGLGAQTIVTEEPYLSRVIAPNA